MVFIFDLFEVTFMSHVPQIRLGILVAMDAGTSSNWLHFSARRSILVSSILI